MSEHRPSHPIVRRMVARDREEEHRASTTLELFFDLCVVVGIALAASNLHHEVIEGHVGDGLLAYALVFFAIWLAWLNFTWFSSAFDWEDAVYRLMTFLQMSGALILAAGIPRIFQDTDLVLATAGYVVMRLALVGQWLRAGLSDGDHRKVAMWSAAGITVLQVLWLLRLLLPDDLGLVGFAVLAVLELLVPVWAEGTQRTTWHPGHITERYGLFTLIVLGESILAATIALQTAFDTGLADFEVVTIAIGGLVLVFSMWWLYFEVEENQLLRSYWGAFFYAYSHLPVFAAAAAVGAGMQVLVENETGHGDISDLGASLAITVPIASYILGVWVVGILPNTKGLVRVAYPACAVLVLAFTGLGAPVPTTGALLALLVAVVVLTDHHAHEELSEAAPIRDTIAAVQEESS
jgi:low temperature requirement protein LtrA